MIKMILVDDDELITIALRTILTADAEIEVLALGKDGEEAIELYNTLLPDVLLLDIRMKKMSGLEATQQILTQHPHAKILLLTTFLDDMYITESIQVGAKGYLLKQDYASLIPAIKAVYNGQSVFGCEIISQMPKLLGKPKQTFSYQDMGITEREQELIDYVAEGYSNKEISEKMYLSEGTVRNYLSSVLEKLNLRDRTQLAVFYYKHQS